MGSNSHHLLDLCNGLGRVQALGARSRTIQNGVASVQTHAVVEGFLSLGGALVT